MFLHLEIAMLRKLQNAEEAGSPITHDQLGNEVHGSTFGDLWAQNEITIKGQSGLVTFASPSSEYIVTQRGKDRLSRYESEQSTVQ